MRKLALIHLLYMLCALTSNAQSIVGTPQAHVTSHQVTVSYSTDFAGSTEIHYGTVPAGSAMAYPNHSIGNAANTSLHSRTISHLAPGTYHYVVRSASTGPGGQAAESAEASFVVPERSGYAPIGDWVINSSANSVAQMGSTLIVGGNFTTVGPRLGAALGFDTTTGTRMDDQPQTAGVVYAVEPDGNGGYFIAGRITSVGGLPRSNIAHVNADLGVDPLWAPSVAGVIRCLKLVGNTLYMGGDFSNVNGQARSFAAAVDARDGTLSGVWQPAFDGTVYAMDHLGGAIFAGGAFTNVAGTIRNHAASVDATSGAVLAWDPNVDGIVYALKADGTTIYLGGSFTTVQSTTRSNAAAVNSTSASLAGWNPRPDLTVRALAVASSSVFVGGDFLNLGSQPTARGYVGEVDRNQGAIAPWNANINAPIYALATDASRLYVGGAFTQSGTTAQGYGAAYELLTGALVAWNPRFDGTVYATASSGSTMYWGGTFASAGTLTPRNYALAIDLNSGSLLSWDPQPNNVVRTVAVDSTASVAYLGGQFTQVAGGVPRGRLAEYDFASLDGGVTAWTPPSINGNVLAVALSAFQDVLYIGGGFTTVGATARNRAAAFDLTSHTLNTWNPNVNDVVRSLLVTPDSVLVGGEFSQVNGLTPRNRIAAVDATSGTLKPAWTATATGAILSMVRRESRAYAVGWFSFFGGSNRWSAAAVDLTSGSPSAWNPEIGPPGTHATAIAQSTDAIFLGGTFSSINGGVARKGAAMVDPDTAAVTSWNPDLGGEAPMVTAMAVDCALDRIVLSGSFNNVGPYAQRGIVVMHGAVGCGLIPPEPPAVDGGTFNDAGVDAGLSDLDSGVEADAGSMGNATIFLDQPVAEAHCGVAYAGWANGVPSIAGNGSVEFEIAGYRPDGFNIDASTGAITWTPLRPQVGRHHVTVVARDQSGTDSLTQEITVACAPKDLRLACGCSSSSSIGAGVAALMFALALRNRSKSTQN